MCVCVIVLFCFVKNMIYLLILQVDTDRNVSPLLLEKVVVQLSVERV